MNLTLSTMRILSLLVAAGIGGCAIAHAPGAPAAPQTAEQANEFANLPEWTEIAVFAEQMIHKHGFAREELEDALRNTRYVERAVQLMKPAPPGKPKNWAAYRARFVEPVRIRGGIAFWDTHQEALAHAERQFGVPAEIIVGIIGVETVYGRNTGSFRVMDAITTLAFAYPDTPTRAKRMAYFRRELENTLLYARNMGIDPFTLEGSYAGAIGLPQFMPGSILQYAVDFDGDGQVDLRNSAADAIGSVANFLVRHGWQSGLPIAFPATVSPAPDNAVPAWQQFIGAGLKATFSLGELRAGGVTPLSAPPAGLAYGLVDLQNGHDPTEYWLATDNFFAITHYNRSYFYAMAVTDLGRAVRQARNAR
jgi:membrane-bound lytic murein transglycosylase B